MSELLKETTEWVWGEKEQHSFEAVRDAICREPVLQIPDPTLPFQIECDASGFATGAVLVQDQGKGFLPCAYASKKFSETETRWTVHEQEALAVIRALREWRPYIHGAAEPVLIYTDHKSLTYLLTQPKLSGKQVRWLIELADYNFKVVYKAGAENVVPDALSRNPDFKGVAGEQAMGA
jgi:ribonuclease HI